MKTKAALAAFAFVAVATIGTATNLLIVPPELMALLILLSAGVALALAASERPTKEIGSGWLTGLILTLGLLSLLGMVGWVVDQVVRK